MLLSVFILYRDKYLHINHICLLMLIMAQILMIMEKKNSCNFDANINLHLNLKNSCKFDANIDLHLNF